MRRPISLFRPLLLLAAPAAASTIDVCQQPSSLPALQQVANVTTYSASAPTQTKGKLAFTMCSAGDSAKWRAAAKAFLEQAAKMGPIMPDMVFVQELAQAKSDSEASQILLNWLTANPGKAAETITGCRISERVPFRSARRRPPATRFSTGC